MKKISAILMIMVMVLACTGCASGLAGSIDRNLNKIKSYEDMILIGAETAEMALGADESELGPVENKYYPVEGKDLNYDVKLEGTKISEFQLWITGGGGVTPEEYEELIGYAIAEFGEDYEFREGAGIIADRVGTYEWKNAKITFNEASSGTGWVVIRFF